MQTVCPHCKTVFRLTDTQLHMADGLVRCGLCKQTFNALHPEQNAGLKREADDQQPDDLFNDAIFGEQMHRVVPDEYRGSSSNASVRAGIVWSIAIVLLAVALLAEAAWFNRNTLQQDTRLKPWIEKFCSLAGCKLEVLRDPDSIEMLSRNVYTHPNRKNALMVAVTMANHAEHDQPYPDIRIAFSDVRGGVVATRRFTPAEYLNLDPGRLPVLPANGDASFTLEIQDPGKQALTYEFSFL